MRSVMTRLVDNLESNVPAGQSFHEQGSAA